MGILEGEDGRDVSAGVLTAERTDDPFMGIFGKSRNNRKIRKQQNNLMFGFLR